MRYSITGATIQQAQSVGATDIVEAKTIHIVFASLTDAQVQKLIEQGCSVTPVGKVQVGVMPPAPVAGLPTYTPAELVIVAGLEEIRKVTSPPLYGESFNIAIVGTGIRKTHRLINGRVVYSKNFTLSPDGDQFDHCTGVASIALAVAPKCGLIDLKVLNAKGEGSEEEVVLAIDHCIDLHEQGSKFAPSVLNLSLGGEDTGDPNNVLRIACREATKRHIWVSAAAGNSGPGPGTIMTPAVEKYVFATGSAKYIPERKSFVVSEFSSRGPTLEGLVKPECLAFGEDIEMASSASDVATVAKSGTSFSTPFNTGIAILYHEATLRFTTPIAVEPIPGISEEYVPLITMEQLIDTWLHGFCLKPEGVPHVKDNEYGEGLVFGPLILRAVQAALRPALDVSSLLGMMMVIPIMGMIMKVAAKPTTARKSK